MKQTMCDSCVWVIHSEGGILGWVVTYVDDILAIAAGSVGTNVIQTIMDHWKCSEMETLSEANPEMGFLGMTLRIIPGKGYFVHQTDYINGLLEKYDMTKCNPSKTILTNKDECLDPAEELELEQARTNANWTVNAAALKQAQKVAGELLWLATRTRVDIAYTMHRLCSIVTTNPARVLRMHKCILRYLKGTADVGIFL